MFGPREWLAGLTSPWRGRSDERTDDFKIDFNGLQPVKLKDAQVECDDQVVSFFERQTIILKVNEQKTVQFGGQSEWAADFAVVRNKTDENAVKNEAYFKLFSQCFYGFDQQILHAIYFFLPRIVDPIQEYLFTTISNRYEDLTINITIDEPIKIKRDENSKFTVHFKINSYSAMVGQEILKSKPEQDDEQQHDSKDGFYTPPSSPRRSFLSTRGCLEVELLNNEVIGTYKNVLPAELTTPVKNKITPPKRPDRPVRSDSFTDRVTLLAEWLTQLNLPAEDQLPTSPMSKGNT